MLKRKHLVRINTNYVSMYGTLGAYNVGMYVGGQYVMPGESSNFIITYSMRSALGLSK